MLCIFRQLSTGVGIAIKNVRRKQLEKTTVSLARSYSYYHFYAILLAGTYHEEFCVQSNVTEGKNDESSFGME